MASIIKRSEHNALRAERQTHLVLCGKAREDFLEEAIFSDRGDSSAKAQMQEKNLSNYGNKKVGTMGLKSKLKGERRQNSKGI